MKLSFRLDCLAIVSLLFLTAVGTRTHAGEDPDTVITFASEKADTLSIFHIRPDGQGLEEVVPAAVARRGEYHPHISRDGRFLSFTTYRYGGWKLAISQRDGSKVRRLTPTNHYVYDGEFSPDGEWLIYRRVETESSPWFRGNLEIFAIKADGTGERNLTRSASEDENPSFSPDGTKIVYQSFLPKENNYEIFVMNRDGSEQKNLTRSAEHEIAPSFSPDGASIAFQREVNDRVELYLMSADGTSIRRLEQASGVAADGKHEATQVWKFDTAFSPDGGSIAFTGMVEGDLELFTIKTDGTGLTRLTHHRGDDLHPVWTRR